MCPPPPSIPPHEWKCAQGVSSRVEGVSSRMSLRAKDMLASVGDDPDSNGKNANSGSGSPLSVASPNGSQCNGESTANGSIHGDANIAAGSMRNGSLRRFFHGNGGAAASASGILNGIANEATTPPAAPSVDEAEVNAVTEKTGCLRFFSVWIWTWC